MEDSDEEYTSSGTPPDVFSAHQNLAEFLFIDHDPVIQALFQTTAALCDPLTQPEDSDSFPLSVALLADLCIAFGYQILLRYPDRHSPSVASLRFKLSLRLFSIIGSINHVLQADEELRLRHSGNDPDDIDHTSKFWLPRGRMGDAASREPLKLMYYMSCVLVMALHRLFMPEDGGKYNAALNPYSAYFLRLWKTHTDILNLALELDRIVEHNAWEARSDDVETPEIVRMVILGSSAVRTVLAYILNEEEQNEEEQNDEKDKEAKEGLHHDVTNESLLNFYDPLTRTAPACGALVRDQTALQMASLVADSMLSPEPISIDNTFDEEWPVVREDEYVESLRFRKRHLGLSLDLTNAVFYDDQVDDDVKYVFGYFDSDDEPSDHEAELNRDDSSVDSIDIVGVAKRAKNDQLEFDEDGRDWRDCARGQNVEFSARFLELEANTMKLGDVKLSNHFFSSLFELRSALEFIELTSIEMVETFVEKIGQVTVDTVAKAIRDEDAGKVSKLNPDHIYKFLVSPAKAEHLAKAQDQLRLDGSLSITNFELILVKNPRTALALLDELFMCKGLRRSLIWFLTHSVNPSMYLLDYIYELVGRKRGENENSLYKFSRKGAIEISDVEEQMVLHEFFSAACKWLIDDVADGLEPESRARSLMSFVCLIIDQLINDGKIKQNTEDSFEDYSHELLALLFPWMGRLSAARDLFFRLKQGEYKMVESEKASLLDVGSDADMGLEVDIVPVIESLRGLSDDEYNVKMHEEPVRHQFKMFGRRLMAHICKMNGVSLAGLELPVPETAPIDDFTVFMANYPEFSRNVLFTSALNTLCTLVNDGSELREAEAEEAEAEAEGEEVEEEVDSEFNDKFLNGEIETSSGKKKKKKKRGKKR